MEPSYEDERDDSREDSRDDRYDTSSSSSSPYDIDPRMSTYDPVVDCQKCSAFSDCIDGECVCREGWVGDGFNCDYICTHDEVWDGEKCVESIDNDDEDELSAFCSITGCTCPTGYQLIDHTNGQICRIARFETATRRPSQERYPCNVENNCDPNASCEFNQYYQTYACVCSDGFAGDGYNCIENEISCLDVSKFISFFFFVLLNLYTIIIGRHM